MPITKQLPHIVLAATLLASPARAQETAQLPEVTVTATGIATPPKRIPAGVTIITRAQIQARGYTTLAETLAAVPGLALVQSGGPGANASVFIRGTNSEDVLVLIDGVPANDPSITNGAFNFGEDTLADIDRIEIIRGPLSGLYGSGAIGGVINIITLQGAQKPQATLTLAGGFPAQGQGSATLTGTSGPFDYALTGSLEEDSGVDATAKRLSVYAGNKDPFRSKTGSANLGLSPSSSTRLYLILRARQTDSAYPDLGYPIFDDPNEFAYDKNLFAKLGVKSDLLSGLLTTELFIARIEDFRRYSNLLDATDPNFGADNDHYNGYRTDMQWNNTIHLPNAGPTTQSAILLGAEYLQDTAKENVNENGFTEFVNAAQHSDAGHLAASTTLFQNLTLTTALREDSVSSFGNALTGRGGAVLAIPQADLALKAAYGTSFLAPSLFDLHGVDNFGYQGNPALKPETGTGLEAGPEFFLPAFGNHKFATLSATYFHNAIKNLITTTPNFSSEENIGQVRINGVETEALLTPTPYLSADLTYTYTDARDATTNNLLLRRPENAGSLTLTLSPLKTLTITPQLTYIGRFYDYLYANTGYPTGTGLARPGTLLNLTATYTATPQLTLFIDAKNLTNSPFEPVNGLQTPGASLLLGIRTTTP